MALTRLLGRSYVCPDNYGPNKQQNDPSAGNSSNQADEMDNYKNTLQTQILESKGRGLSSVKFGANLSEEHLKNFQEEQIGQLYELMLESTKPNNQFDIQEDTFTK
ncbi:hypothetical protein WMY93_020453 [Mugilogobius chulae]|uniref:Uncharacterized protein n=1 Tax=Mugilogobius chulae TaxID=88201 RepID=A0AAW0NM34_9GOBI